MIEYGFGFLKRDNLEIFVFFGILVILIVINVVYAVLYKF